MLVNSILTNGVTTNGLAVLGWVPLGGALGANGYAFGFGPNGAALIFNSSFVYVTNFATPLPTNNLYMAMRMTPDGANMIVKSTVYKKSDGRYNVLFEYTRTNTTSTLIGTGGNAVVGAFNDTSGAATSVSFDDLQYFDTVRALLDDFSGPYPGTSWTDYIPGTATNYNDGAGHLVTVDQSSGPTSGTYKSDKTFKVSDGVRLELRADVVDATANGLQNFAVFGYLPDGLANFATLKEYHIAFTAGQFYVGKAFGNWWDTGFGLAAPQTNVRLIQTLTGEGTSVRIESRLEDLSKDVNDPARVVYQRMFVDSSSPYLNFDGYIGISQYRNAAPGNAAVVWDNVEVNYPVGGNAAPIISGLTPADGKNFYNATGGVTFDVTDDASAPINNIKLTLNGVVYTNGSPGLTITPTVVSSLSRHVTFTNLAPDVFYVGSIRASDNLGATILLHYEFDTFQTNRLQVEAEDFNYSTNVGVNGGQFIDGGLNAYAGLQGTAEIDFHDSRTTGNGANPIPYRPLDPPRQYPTGDGPRAQYVNAAQSEYLVYDNANGDWKNYSRTFTAGTFKVYLRESTFALPRSLVTLERVTSDPSTNGQTTTGLGAFIQPGDGAGDTGYDVHRNVLLTDISGNPAVVRFAGGVDTVRLSNRFVDDRENSDVFQNYLVFVPTADPGTLRPIVTSSSPVPGDTFRQSPATTATVASIANRDTSVSNGTIVLKINGTTVTPTITTSAGGADVAWSLSDLPPSATFTNTLTFKDTDGTNLTYSWTYSYPFLRATNRLAGALSTRGFDYRMVQTDGPTLGNNINRAEQQLAIPPQIAIDRGWRTNVQTQVWNDNTGVPNYVPGLEPLGEYPTGTPPYTNSVGPPFDNIATESLGYMQLTAGAHRFSAISDDGFQVRSGTTPKDTGAAVMGFQNGTFNGSFDFVVEAAGLYPVRSLWYENGGDAHFSLSDDSNNLVNDPLNPPGVVRVYLPGTPAVLLSSATVSGPYTIPAGAVYNSATKTVTVPITGSTQFYRISASSALTIQSISVVGGNVVITWL